MFVCERCRTRFNAGAATSALNCPRCRAKGLFSPLTFETFGTHALRDHAHDRDPTATSRGRRQRLARLGSAHPMGDPPI